MKCIKHYEPPSARDLARLKVKLSVTSQQMADLAGLAQGARWRKYTGGDAPRELSMQMHFYMAALLTLGDDEVGRITDLMRSQGAQVDLEPVPSGPTTA